MKMKTNRNTKAFKVLEFIAESGDEGVRFTDIQEFICCELNDYTKEEFEEKTKCKWNNSTPARNTRGYWCDALYNCNGRKGILNEYCYKNDKGRWVLDYFPSSREPIFKQSFKWR